MKYYLAESAAEKILSEAGIFDQGKKLEQFGISEVQAILFRCTREELLQLGSLADRDAFDRYAADMAQKELRWKIILERFINVEKEII